MSYRRKRESIVAKITEGFLEKAVDATLVGIFFQLEFPKYARSQRWKLSGATEEHLEKTNYQTIKRALYNLNKNGLIQTIKETSVLPKITQEGLKRLNSILPHYDKERAWNGKVYLITYDLPISKNNERNALRNILKKIRCGKLQDSVWVTPYNPIEILRTKLFERGINDLVIISSLGRDGAIGDTSLSEMMIKAFSLDEINQKYLDLIYEYQNQKVSRDQFIFQYLSILEEDPQLPFELLPERWTGDRVYEIYYKLTMHVHG